MANSLKPTFWVLVFLAAVYLLASVDARRSRSTVTIRCPPSKLLYQPTRQCYPNRSEGPCGPKRTLVEKTDGIGQCICKEMLVESNLKPFVYSQRQRRCYAAYERGPCKRNEYIKLVVNSGPTCVRNPCSSNKISVNGTCLELGASCADRGTVKFEKGDLEPKCVPAFTTKTIAAIPALCPVGQLRTPDGRGCATPITWDW